MKKKSLLISIVFIMLAAYTLPVYAQNYTFENEYVSLDIYEWPVVLVSGRLSEQSSYLDSIGSDAESMQAVFNSEGILLEAIDDANQRTFVLSCLKTVDSEMYFDLNKQDNDMRKEYRTGHTNGAGYSLAGYRYSHATWKNYGGEKLRFLCTEYTFSSNGKTEHSGYQRRTIRNGYTITLDMQVRGRNLKSSDEKALESLMTRFNFTKILPLPKLPTKLSITSEPPAVVKNGSFSIKGTTAKKANVTVTAISFTSASSTVYQAAASTSGAFSVKVTLPGAGIYSVIISAEGDDSLRTQITYTVNYQ